MSKFVYRMQSILNIKEKMETQAKMQYAQARMELTEEEKKLELLFQRKQKYEEEAKGLLKEHLNVQKIKEAKEAILQMQEFILLQTLEVSSAEKKLEVARMNLQEVMQERKTHERLREKAFEEFIQEENASERKEIDQLTSYRYGLKK